MIAFTVANKDNIDPLIVSCLTFKKYNDIKLKIYTDKESFERLKKIFDDVNIYDFDTSIKSESIMISPEIVPYISARIDILEKLSKEHETIINFDADTYFLKPLDLKIDKPGFYGVDQTLSRRAWFKRMGLKDLIQDISLNTGFCIYNKLDCSNLYQNYLKFLDMNKITYCTEQDFLNLNFYKNKYIINQKYNALANSNVSIDDCVMCHFAGSFKPWSKSDHFKATRNFLQLVLNYCTLCNDYKDYLSNDFLELVNSKYKFLKRVI